jgi:hypothetical protein
MSNAGARHDAGRYGRHLVSSAASDRQPARTWHGRLGSSRRRDRFGIGRGQSVGHRCNTKQAVLSMIQDRFSPEYLGTLTLGAKVPIRIQKTPAIPSQVRAMNETNMRQHATDAWSTAWKLKNILTLWHWFQILHELAICIDGPTQRAISRMFPDLGKFQMILAAWADLKSHEAKGDDSCRSRFPVGDWFDLYRAFRNLIASHTKALCKIGVNLTVLAQSADEVQQRFVGVTDGDFDLSALKFGYDKQKLNETSILIGSLSELIKLLETAPATAVMIPKESVDKEQYKHSPDFTSVVWEGQSYTFTRGQQAECIRLLWQAWENNTPVLAEKDIGSTIEAENNNFQLSKVFRKKKKGGGYEHHPAWGTMIQKANKGSFQLAAKKI